jgi:hypothetical protein
MIQTRSCVARARKEAEAKAAAEVKAKIEAETEACMCVCCQVAPAIGPCGCILGLNCSNGHAVCIDCARRLVRQCPHCVRGHLTYKCPMCRAACGLNQHAVLTLIKGSHHEAKASEVIYLSDDDDMSDSSLSTLPSDWDDSR